MLEEISINPIVRALELAARLDYSGENLRFNSEVLDVAFAILYPDAYTKILNSLKAKKAADEEMNKGE